MWQRHSVSVPRRAMWVKAAFLALARNLQVVIDERKQAA